MTAKVGPENGEICSFVYLDAQVEKPRAICAVMVKKHDSRRSLGTAKQPASRGGVIAISPGLVSNLKSWTADLSKGLRSYQVRSARRVGDPTNNEGKRYSERHCHHQ
jgi:hypothetical protein